MHKLHDIEKDVEQKAYLKISIEGRWTEGIFKDKYIQTLHTMLMSCVLKQYIVLINIFIYTYNLHSTCYTRKYSAVWMIVMTQTACSSPPWRTIIQVENNYDHGPQFLPSRPRPSSSETVDNKSKARAPVANTPPIDLLTQACPECNSTAYAKHGFHVSPSFTSTCSPLTYTAEFDVMAACNHRNWSQCRNWAPDFEATSPALSVDTGL